MIGVSIAEQAEAAPSKLDRVRLETWSKKYLWFDSCLNKHLLFGWSSWLWRITTECRKIRPSQTDSPKKKGGCSSLTVYRDQHRPFCQSWASPHSSLVQHYRFPLFFFSSDTPKIQTRAFAIYLLLEFFCAITHSFSYTNLSNNGHSNNPHCCSTIGSTTSSWPSQLIPRRCWSLGIQSEIFPQQYQ